ncbi:MAG: hypothetical protein ACOYNF_02225 [Rhodoferax sp.]
MNSPVISANGGMMQVAITVAIGGYASLTVTASDRFFSDLYAKSGCSPYG